MNDTTNRQVGMVLLSMLVPQQTSLDSGVLTLLSRVRSSLAACAAIVVDSACHSNAAKQVHKDHDLRVEILSVFSLNVLVNVLGHESAVW